MGHASSNLSLLSRKSVQPLGTDSSFIPYTGKLSKHDLCFNTFLFIKEFIPISELFNIYIYIYIKGKEHAEDRKWILVLRRCILAFTLNTGNVMFCKLIRDFMMRYFGITLFDFE